MKAAKPDFRLWFVGLAVFGLVVGLGMWLRSASGFGIVDHQIAGTAQVVDRIQADWSANGVRWLAIAAMVGDLIFIGIYSVGAWRAGRSFAHMRRGILAAIGWIVAIAAVIFCFTDYVETVLQLIQLVRDSGSDAMAGTAAAMQGWKVISWIVTFIGIVLGAVIARFSKKPA